MIVRFYASLRDVTGTKEARIAGCKTVGELLKRMCDKYGKAFEDLLLRDGSLIVGVMVLVNGTHIAHLQGLDTLLSDDCVVDVFPPVAGG